MTWILANLIVLVPLIAVVCGTVYYLFPVITVCGDSMYPTYCDGEIVFGTRLFRKSKLKRGDVVLFHAPNDRKRIVIKRIEEVRKGAGVMYCLGDNPDQSYDSRMYGYIALSNAVCKPIKSRKRGSSNEQ